MRSATRCAPRGGSGCDRYGVPRLPARCSGPARGPAPARTSLGHGGPSLRPRSRYTRSKRSLGVAFRPRSAHHPDGLARYGFRCTESSCRPLGRGGEPLATARSRRVMDRSLRLAPITKEAPIAHRRSRPLEVSACCGNLSSICPASCSPWSDTAACTA